MCWICGQSESLGFVAEVPSGIDPTIRQGAADTVPGNTTTTFSISLGGSVTGSINTTGDQDWYRVILSAGQTYTISLNGQAGQMSALGDSYLRVFNAAGTEVAFNDDGGGSRNSLLTYTPTIAGTYYLSAGGYSNSYTGSYILNISTGVTPPPPVTTDVAIFTDRLTDAELYNRIECLMTYTASRFNSSTNPVRVLTYQFETAAPSDAPSWATDYTWSALNSAEQSATRDVLAEYERFINVDFQEVSGQPDADLSLAHATMSASYSGQGGWRFQNGGVIYDGWALFNTTRDLSLATNRGLIAHELGHAMSMRHPGNYDINPANAPAPPYLPTDEDTNQYSVMSYNNNAITNDRSLALMVYDVAALQYRWGANLNTATGNDTYTSNAASALRVIWDAAGSDTIDGSALSSNSVIDLRGGAFSSLGTTSNLAIAFGAVIENAIGGAGADTITGNATNNIITGNGGADVIDGGLGSDTLRGGDGADIIRGEGAQVAAPVAGNGNVIRLTQSQFTSGAGVITFDSGTNNPNYTLNVAGLGNVTITTGGRFVGQFAGALPANTVQTTLTDNTPTIGSILTLDPAAPVTYVSTDNSTPTSPILSGTPQFYGTISVRFSQSVSAVGLTAGYFNSTRSTRVEAYDINGNVLGSVVNENTGIEFFGLATSNGAANIAGFSIYAVASDLNGFGIDNLTFGPASAVEILNANDIIDGGANDDQIFGDFGNDYIDGGTGNDQIDAGSGDDLVIYDSADTAGNVRGGEGYDTLLVNTGNSAPTGFNLAAQGFEHARFELADSGNSAWANIAQTFNSAWQMLTQLQNNDNGSRALTTYDRASETWSYRVEQFNAAGARAEQQTYNDNGTRNSYYWDDQSNQTWREYGEDYNAAGQRLVQRIYNDGNSYRFFYWDLANGLNWTNFDEEFNAAGGRHTQRIVYDGGNTRNFYWDVTNTQTWVTFDEEFTAGPGATRSIQRITNDNGTTSQQFWDTNNSQSYSTYVDYMSAAGQRTEQRIFHDQGANSGGYSRIYYDPTNVQPWSTRTDVYSAAGILTSSTTVPG